MRVKIVSHTSPYKFAEWWYVDRVGEEFEVEDNSYALAQYNTVVDGMECGIMKCDCEEVEHG